MHQRGTPETVCPVCSSTLFGDHRTRQGSGIWPSVVIRPGKFVRYAYAQAARGYMSGIVPRSGQVCTRARPPPGVVSRGRSVSGWPVSSIPVYPRLGQFVRVSLPGAGFSMVREQSLSGAPGGFSGMHASKITAGVVYGVHATIDT